jgi:hypothetical protein
VQLRCETRQALVQRTVDNVVAVDRKMIGEVFHVLRWTSRDLDRMVTVLLEEGAVREVAVERTAGLEKRDGRGALRGIDLEP